MALRQITRDIIKLVEEKSGIPVRVVEDEKLPTIAAVKIARKGGLPTHLVTYKSYPGEGPDYQICMECAYILRLFSNPPEKRFDITDTVKGQQDVEKLMSAPGGVAVKYRLPKAQLDGLRSQFLGGLITHLRSVPVWMRIGTWLAVNYPELEKLEPEHVQKELQINRQTLKGDIKEITPSKIFKATQAINAAYALFWSDAYNKPEYFNIYRVERFEKDARALLDLYEQMPDDPTSDQALVDAWGKHLGLTDWYSWRPYEPPEKVADAEQ